MAGTVLADSGFLTALVRQRDKHRAWASGELKEIEIGKDEEGNIEKVLLPKAPVATLAGQPTPEHAGIHASIAYRVRGLGGILFKYPLPIELDLRVKLEPNAKNEVEVVLEEIDEKTLKIDTSAVWFWPFRAKVDALVREKIAKLNVELREKRNLLIAIPTLDSLIGVKLKLTRVRTEAGNLTLYGDFDVKR